ncbi:MAG TPA: hypothetical protein VN622_10915 [Clostridia bacterium]|nr:hypothetical protein [Clostridia bacterium]
MKTLLVAVLFAALSTPVSAGDGQAQHPQKPASPSNSFMRNQLGQSIKDSKRVLKGGNFFAIVMCDGRGNGPGVVVCINSSSGGELPKTMLWHVDNKLAKITYIFFEDDYAGMVRALTAKYGASSDATTQEVQNRMGAKFVGTNHTWKSGDTEILSFQYFGTVDQSVVILKDHALNEELDKRMPSSDPKI